MRFIFLIFIIAIGLTTTPSSARAESFQEFLQTLAIRASREGVSQDTINKYLLSIEKPLPAVISKDRKQGEFILSFRTYYNRTVTDERVALGLQHWQKYKDLLTAAEQQYNIPASLILACWGLESSFGNTLGDYQPIVSLATLAYEGRRRDFFSNEVISALKIIDSNHFNDDFIKRNFFSSWAGAMGQVQFMPSTYLRYAVDGDGDGKKDLWHNPADVIFSTAHFLKELGYQGGEPWGHVIALPDDFPYHHVNDDRSWRFNQLYRMGVITQNGEKIPNQISRHGIILIPMSASGPIFLTERNFYIIKKWNNSNAFALSVGLLADRIAGMGKSLAFDNSIPNWRTDDIITIQTHLKTLGFLSSNSKADGILGPKTRSAIQNYQSRNGLLADGYPTEEFFTSLKNSATEQ